MLRDHLVCDLAHSGTRKKLLTEMDLTLQKAIEMATAVGMAILQDTQPTAVWESEEVHRLNYEGQYQCCGKRGHSTATCQLRHGTCYRYGERDHIQVMCNSSKKFTLGKKQANQMTPKDEEDDLCIWIITGRCTEGYHVHLKLDHKLIKMK